MSVPLSQLPARIYKLTVIGGGGVGKSCITTVFLKGEFKEDYDPTIEDSYRSSCVIDDEPAVLDILDTTGQEEYRAMRDSYMRDAEGFIMVYAINARDSFEELYDFYTQIIRIKDVESFANVIVVGNKCDLEYERRVSINEGRDLAKRFGGTFLEVSAKRGLNINETFHTLVRQIRQQNKDLRTALHKPQYAKPEKAGCCGSCIIA